MPLTAARPEPACLLIADISGYTSYLSGVELDHAQDVLTDLMSTVVQALSPPFALAKLEGDAAFVHLDVDGLDGSLVQDTIETTYIAFRRRLRDIQGATTCTCDACLRIPGLDLKVVAHVGEVGRSSIAGHDELVGADVILVHRLLKNDVTSLGYGAYALYTDAFVRQAGIDPLPSGLTEHHELTDVRGDVRCWLRDLRQVWQDYQDRARVAVDPTTADVHVQADVPAGRPVLWEYLTVPARRVLWQSALTQFSEASPDGRRGVGTVNHCVHGEDAVVEEILDWRPLDYVTLRTVLRDGAPPLLLTMRVSEHHGNGRITIDAALPQDGDPDELAGFSAALRTNIAADAARLEELLQRPA